MRQLVVQLTDCLVLSYAPIGTSSTYGQTFALNANGLHIWLGGGTFSIIKPSAPILDEYCAMYEYYMVEHLEVQWIPVCLEVETTSTGTQDTAVYPTVCAKDSDTNLGLFSPPTSLAAL
jgi:hypothetical protein